MIYTKGEMFNINGDDYVRNLRIVIVMNKINYEEKKKKTQYVTQVAPSNVPIYSSFNEQQYCGKM